MSKRAICPYCSKVFTDEDGKNPVLAQAMHSRRWCADNPDVMTPATLDGTPSRRVRAVKPAKPDALRIHCIRRPDAVMKLTELEPMKPFFAYECGGYGENTHVKRYGYGATEAEAIEALAPKPKKRAPRPAAKTPREMLGLFAQG